ncbi:hypothetical protein GF336_03845 [Candidatus Woesearchaeota archaeon]|nr:hypothetical protein [Candidatus Woesearchaeota archaeon]
MILKMIMLKYNVMLEWVKKNRKKLFLLIFLALLFYGSLIRLYGLEENSFWIDESMSALAAKKIHENGYPLLESGFVYSRAPVFHYLMSGFLFFGYNEFNARLISVLFGVATCILIYFIAAEYNKDAAWLAFTFSLFLEIFIVYSRQARMYQMEMFLFFLTVFLVYKSLYRKTHLLGAGVSFLLAYNTHPVALLLLPFFFYSFLKNRMNKWIYIAAGLVSLYLAYSLLERLSDFRLFYLADYILYLRYYAPFVLVSLAGFIITLKKRLTLFLGLSAVLIFAAVSFEKLFALRYVYLVFFPMVVLASVALSRIRFRWVVAGLYILWLSNIFTPITYSFVLAPEMIVSHNDITSPRAGFRQIYQEIEGIYEDETLIVSITSESGWYFKNPDYWIYFSFNRIPVPAEKSFTVYNGRDIYTGADIIYDADDLNDIKEKKIIVIDDWAAGRIDPGINSVLDNCKIISEKEGIKAYRC